MRTCLSLLLREGRAFQPSRRKQPNRTECAGAAFTSALPLSCMYSLYECWTGWIERVPERAAAAAAAYGETAPRRWGEARKRGQAGAGRQPSLGRYRVAVVSLSSRCRVADPDSETGRHGQRERDRKGQNRTSQRMQYASDSAARHDQRRPTEAWERSAEQRPFACANVVDWGGSGRWDHCM